MFLALRSLKNQRGQALLIIVLVMVVALTVGLSVATRTIINLRNTQQQADSQKALSAAEAGIEQAIKNQTSAEGTFGTGGQAVSYATTLQDISTSAPFLTNGGNQVSKNDAIYVWLSPYTSNFTQTWPNGDLKIYWGEDPNPCNNAALEIAVISGSKATPSIARYVFDPCPSRQAANNFYPITSAGTTTISGKTLYYEVQAGITPNFPTISNGMLVRIDPIYSNAYIGAYGTNLPPQGTIYTSIATTSANITRKVQVFQGYPEIPAEFFPYILFQP